MSYKLKYTGQQIDGLLDKINEIFVAEYGSTIYSEITEAIAAGNQIIVANAGKVYTYAGQDANGGYVFTQSGPDATKPSATYVTLSTGDIWSTSAVDLATLQQFYQSLMEDTITDAAIASFPDGADSVPVKSMTVSINPIQNLNGYDHPWPDGGGKNKLPLDLATIKSLNTSGTWSGNAYTINGVTYTVNTDSAGNVTGIIASGTATGTAQILLCYPSFPAGSYILNGCPSGGNWDNRYGINFRYDNATHVDAGAGRAIEIVEGTLQGRVEILCRTGYPTSGTTLAFYPMIRISTETDSTFAPYSNICPIEGHTGAEIPVTGINVWDEEWEVGGINNNTGGDDDLNTAVWRSKNYLPVKPDTKYYFQKGALSGGLRYYWYDKDKAFISGASIDNSNALTSPVNAYFLRIRDVTAGGNQYANNISVNYPSTDTDYHAYNGTNYSVSWTDHGTVYKGTAKYKGNGEWEITDLWKSIDLGTLNYGTFNDGRFYTSNIQHFAQAVIVGGVPYGEGLCSQYDFIQQSIGGATADCTINMFIGDYGGNNGRIFIKDTAKASMTAAQFKAAMSGVQLTYLVDSPTSFTVTGPTPETLLGDNNIWANTGDIEELTYRANTALYIQKMLGGSAKTTIASTLSIKKPTAISTADIEQAGEVSEAVEDAEQIEEPEVSEEPPEEITEDPEPVEAEEEPEEEQAAEPEAEQPAEEPAKITEEAKAPVVV